MTTMIDEQLAADEGADQSLRKLHHEREISIHMREPMFEKQLTPSDVGKLNRLVIPKQHALNFFPLIHGSNNKGKKETSLSFEDELGKSWRFRYSFWDSSQSFVFTRGWSRFVRDKRLLAGDVVVFERHQVDRDRFFIEWRARRTAPMKDSASVAQAPTMADYSPGSSVQKPLAPTGDIKRLRLFGVNMEFRQLEPESPSLYPASLSSHDPPLSTA